MIKEAETEELQTQGSCHHVRRGLLVCMLKKLPLFASLQVVDKDSEEAKIIKQYVKNTHAATHNAYDLKVVDVSWAILGFKFVKADSSKTCLQFPFGF